MSQYNIEMNSYDGSQYNQLYPKTLLNNISDWSSMLYSKDEVDSKISSVNNLILGRNNYSLITTTTLNMNQATINLPKQFKDYYSLFIYVNNYLNAGNVRKVYLDKIDGDTQIGQMGSTGQHGSTGEASILIYFFNIGILAFSVSDVGTAYDTNYTEIMNIKPTELTNKIIISRGTQTADTRGTLYVYGIENSPSD